MNTWPICKLVDIGKWDYENSYLRNPKHSHSCLRNLPYFNDVKTLHKILLVLYKMDWAKICSVSGIFIASDLNSCSICKKPLLWPPCITAQHHCFSGGRYTPRTTYSMCTYHPLLGSHVSPVMFRDVSRWFSVGWRVLHRSAALA